MEQVIFRYKKLTPYEKRAYCPECNIPLKHSGTGYSWSMNSKCKSIIHSCEKCKKEYDLDSFYPRTMHSVLEDLDDKPQST